VPATSAAQNRLLFFSFFAAAVYRTNEANKAGLKQSIFLDVYGYYTHDRQGKYGKFSHYRSDSYCGKTVSQQICQC
jgi:hypothetical protein